MADRKTATALTRNPVVVEPFSVATVDYLDSKPNYFRVQNNGGATVYCSTSGFPTTHNYDFMVKPGSMMSFADPHNRTKFYIFNPSGEAVNCIVVSFAAEFDPLVLALGQIEIEVPDTIESTTVISSFSAPLPPGNNKIGSVVVTNMNDYSTVLDELKNVVNTIYYQDFTDFFQVFEIEGTGEHTLCNDGNFHIKYIANDGESVILLNLGEQAFPILPGEKIENIKFRGNVKVTAKESGATFKFRCLCGYP